jgi:hypothetical protein
MPRQVEITEAHLLIVLDGLLNNKTNKELAAKIGKNVGLVRKMSCMFNVYADGERVELDGDHKAFLRALSTPSPEIVRRVLYAWKTTYGGYKTSTKELGKVMHNMPAELLLGIKSPVPPAQQPTVYDDDGEEQKTVTLKPVQNNTPPPDKKETGRAFGTGFNTLPVDAYSTEPAKEVGCKTAPAKQQTLFGLFIDDAVNFLLNAKQKYLG